MSNFENFDFDQFLSERAAIQNESERTGKLVKKYKKSMPEVSPKWDCSASSVSFNGICDLIVASGITIFEAPFVDVWGGIYKPDIYAGKTMWDSKLHDSDKIAKVIEAWELGADLSPIFLVRHLTKDIGLVADGKHRLTVSHYLRQSCGTLPFMVETDKSSWVKIAIPSATQILQT
jgi:hypothetical protein